MPFVCSRCGACKRNDDGQLVYAPASVVRRHQPQVCPTCFEALTLAHALGKLVLWEEDEDSEVSDKLAIARLAVGRKHPYYSAVLWALQPVPVKDMAKLAPGPMGVDKHLRLYYDPEAIESWSNAMLFGVLCHEIGHVLRAHSVRCGERDPFLFNVAGDLEINDDLADDGLTLPPFAVYPKTFKLPNGLVAEEYYDRLPVVKVTVTGPGGGKCGSIAGGPAEGHEQPAEGNGTVPPGVTQAEAELMRQQVAQDVMAAKSRGDVPGWLERWAKARLKSKVDWRRLLAAYIRRACGDARGAVDFSYRRPSRRQSALPDFVLPTLQQPTPRIAVVVDTSGSMSTRELDQALTEIAAVLESQGHREGVTVLAVDAAVHTSQKVFRPEQVKLAGGGGTDMGIGITAAAALRPRPHVIVCVSDGETPWGKQPVTPVILALTQRRPGYKVPSWARVVYVGDQKDGNG